MTPRAGIKYEDKIKYSLENRGVSLRPKPEPKYVNEYGGASATRHSPWANFSVL